MRQCGLAGGGDTPEWSVDKKEFGTNFVPRVVEVWRQWALVDKLMSERFVSKLRADKVDGKDGFSGFGKECREFIFRFQSMAMQDFSKSYYLHTLLHLYAGTRKGGNCDSWDDEQLRGGASP